MGGSGGEAGREVRRQLSGLTLDCRGEQRNDGRCKTQQHRGSKIPGPDMYAGKRNQQSQSTLGKCRGELHRTTTRSRGNEGDLRKATRSKLAVQSGELVLGTNTILKSLSTTMGCRMVHLKSADRALRHVAKKS